MAALFHLAFPVHDLTAAKRFYVDGLGCVLGRESSTAVTFGLAGHQLVAHLAPLPKTPQQGIYPRHFGLVLTEEEEWQAMVDRARSLGLSFYQQPRTRFAGTAVEHRTFFLEDPSHNLLEFKHYRFASAIFGERAIAAVGDADSH
ncbi:glyoxalase [Nitrospirales bacterium NOB]|nr:MAG: putative glyoxalase [Nitrospira sp. OLB3]MBV6468319.1 hypothetical protein [Nitrospirota bacterium]MCE7963835.1 glyoxalase [Nitrospira sp. NTP2]MDL1889860.1 glyoxalase [Nitrospirales bacterium NOB]MEB2337568.1 VOC family protein [Nitrospirales bacterium]QOJ35503.1 MAG: VOC family protein [Nitrospira sp.]